MIRVVRIMKVIRCIGVSIMGYLLITLQGIP